MRRAFSLVELSIVLVILGLLVGGILAGQSLIRASELRAVTNEYQRYTTAVFAFRDKYFALPGDMTNATSFWGTAAACPGTSSTPSTTSATCNGDGDGRMLWTAGPTSNEIFRSWQHLANAGLIEGTYSGVANSTTVSNYTYGLVGTNLPRSKMNNAGWAFFHAGSVAISDTTFFDGQYGNLLFFGANTATSLSEGVILKPEEAWNIDTKLDDGKPATGAVVSRENSGGSTSTACSDLAASTTVSLAASNYSLSNTGINCPLVFKTGF